MRQFVLLTRFPPALQKRKLVLLGCVSLAVYGAVAALSVDFGHEAPAQNRPILAVLALFGCACLLYIASLAVVAHDARRARDSNTCETGTSGSAFGGVLLFSVLFHLVLLVSVPIQEVDFYRYLWDGRVLCQGFDPYRFAPSQIDAAKDDAPPELSALATIRDMSGPVKDIFSRVHHRQVPTIYPPAAQVLFALCAAATPATAPVWLHVFILKLLLIAVDVAILFAMRGLLRHAGFAEAWCIAYGWCPLAIKEVANSAHIDGLAVLFTLVALQLALNAVRATTSASASIARWTLAGGFLGLAILSKTYPIVLLPLMAAFAFAHIRRRALVPLVVCLVVVSVGYLPFLKWPTAPESTVASFSDAELSTAQQKPWSGLEMFLMRWQMNDLLFMVVHENLRPPFAETNRWFVVTPSGPRLEINQHAIALLTRLGVPAEVEPAFMLTQIVMGTLLLGLLLWCAWQAIRRPEPLVLLRSASLVLAWAWFMSSAQNPWYVLWFLPLMPFARCRSWFLVPCLALIYYLRFWMVYQGDGLSTNGECPAFDFGWVWVEHGAVLVAVASESLGRSYGWFGFSAASSALLAPPSVSLSAGSSDVRSSFDS